MAFAANKICVVAVLGVLLVLAPSPSRAELIRVEITKRVDILNGKVFGASGPYEKLHGKAY
ncbi:MAG: hypothetical protein ACRD2A_23580, partial [Vicinamibacterales bacterium]